MNILESILEYDFHGTTGSAKVPLLIEIPAKKEFLPAVVSSGTPGKFIITKAITKENRIRTGVFNSVDENSDSLLNPLFATAHDCSVQMGMNNRFPDLASAIAYIKESSGIPSMPHSILIPKSIDAETCLSKYGVDPKKRKYEQARVLFCDVSKIVVLSRPDFVGLFTRFTNNAVSVLLHNVALGIAFVD